MPCNNNNVNPSGIDALSNQRQGKPPGSGDPSICINAWDTKGQELVMTSTQNGIKKNTPPVILTQARFESFMYLL